MISRVVVLNDACIARGGATGLALLSIRKLRQRGISVTFIVGDTGENEELRDLNVEVVPVGGKALMAAKSFATATSGIYNPSAREAIAGWIAANDTPRTVYHMHGWSKILSPSAFTALRPVAARTVIHAHDFFLACPNGAFMDYPRFQPCHRMPLGLDCLTTNCDRRSYPQKLWRVARQSTLLFTIDKRKTPWSRILLIHERMAPFIQKAGYRPELLTTIRNPAEPFRASRVPVEENDRFFFIGRLEAEKGVEDALKAARLARVPMDIIGDGPLRAELEAAYPEATYHGWRSREEIGMLIGKARALVIPSRYPEPFGLVAAEAATAGLPILITQTALLAEEIVRNGIGMACNTQDVTVLAAHFRRFADLNADTVRAMSKRAHANVERLSTTEDEWTDQLISVYSECLQHHSARQHAN